MTYIMVEIEKRNARRAALKAAYVALEQVKLHSSMQVTDVKKISDMMKQIRVMERG